jgi:hypothetical protein
LATNAVGAGKIASGAINNSALIGSGVVTGTNIASSTISTSNLNFTVPTIGGTNSWTGTNTFSGTFSVTTASGNAVFTPTIQATNGLTSTNGFIFINGSTPTLNFQNAAGSVSYGQVFSSPTQTVLGFGSNAFVLQTSQFAMNIGGSTAFTFSSAGQINCASNVASATGLFVNSTYGTQYAYGIDNSSAKIYVGNGAIPAATLTQTVFQITGAGYQPGGGSWLASSDIRVKQNITPYTKTINDLSSLSPVSYEYNGEYGTVEDGKTHVGFVAQNLIGTPFESMISQTDYKDPVTDEITEIYSVNTTELSFALLNAVMELNARLKALEEK